MLTKYIENIKLNKFLTDTKSKKVDGKLTQVQFTFFVLIVFKKKNTYEKKPVESV